MQHSSCNNQHIQHVNFIQQATYNMPHSSRNYFASPGLALLELYTRPPTLAEHRSISTTKQSLTYNEQSSLLELIRLLTARVLDLWREYTDPEQICNADCKKRTSIPLVLVPNGGFITTVSNMRRRAACDGLSSTVHTFIRNNSTSTSISLMLQCATSSASASMSIPIVKLQK
jgi:hypothetical protein